MTESQEPLVSEIPDTLGNLVRVETDRRASIAELADVLILELGARHQPSEPTATLAIRVLREQNARIAQLDKQLRAAKVEALTDLLEDLESVLDTVTEQWIMDLLRARIGRAEGDANA